MKRALFFLIALTILNSVLNEEIVNEDSKKYHRAIIKTCSG
jgi:hypothetical protein